MNAGEGALRGRAGKSASAFRTTSEIAEELNLPPHVLRFWESKFTELKPLRRGGGRRYYRPEDVALLRRIQELLYRDGYTIRGVQKLLREGGLGEKGPEGEASRAPAPMDRGERKTHPSAEVLGLRGTLEEVRGELLAIRALLDRALKGGE